MSRNVIRSIRKGSVQWNEEDRLKVSTTRSGLKMQLHWRKSLPSWTPMVLPVVPSGNLEWKSGYSGQKSGY